jgi:hypothetical protein
MRSEIRAGQSRVLGSAWRRSSFCAGGECVEVSRQGEFIAVRNSSAPEDVLRCTPTQFRSFVRAVKSDWFDNLG